jgi:hypothetical protein
VLAFRTQRLPFDRQCAAITRSGRRCRGKIRQGSDFCPFHDPRVTAEHRRRVASEGGKRSRRLRHLPDGYLRKLTSRRAVGEAMDRLYREVRLEILTPEMGTVLFNILERILDSGLVDEGAGKGRPSGRSRADKLRPKVRALLTPGERAAWAEAIAHADDPAADGHAPPLKPMASE